MPRKISSKNSSPRNSRRPIPTNKKPNNIKNNSNNENCLNIRALSLAIGTIWGFAIFAITLMARSNGYGQEFLNSISSLYPGYEISLAGAIVGGLYGLIEAIVGVYLVAKLYSFFNCSSRCR